LIFNASKLALMAAAGESSRRLSGSAKNVLPRFGAGMLLWLIMAAPLLAQQPEVHYRHHSRMPPGAIGSWRLMQGGPVHGHYQPVEIKAPQGALVSLAENGNFGEPQATPLQVGMLISPVYRLRVTNIPNLAGAEVFPTIEVIDRIYPPARQSRTFPIPVELTRQDLELALSGRFVTRIIYLEDPETALPVSEDPNAQQWFEASVADDPLHVADTLGRPVAILRMGGLLPESAAQPSMEFLRGCPPFIRFGQRVNRAPLPGEEAAQ